MSAPISSQATIIDSMKSRLSRSSSGWAGYVTSFMAFNIPKLHDNEHAASVMEVQIAIFIAADCVLTQTQRGLMTTLGGGSLPLPAAPARWPRCHSGLRAGIIDSSMATLPGSSGPPLCGRTALRNLLLSAHGHQGGASGAGPATPRLLCG